MRALPHVTIAAIAGLQLYSLWMIYRAGDFGYFDLGLINDWMTNALRGNPFLITNTGSNHLTYNFTPSLVLLAPFWIWDSQFILVIVTVITFYAGTGLILREGQRILDNGLLSPIGTSLLMVALALCAGENRFTRYVLMYPHFEAIFTLPASVLFLCLNRAGKSYRVLAVPVTLFACGLRQDAGFYLCFFLIASALVVPVSMRDVLQRLWLPVSIAATSTLVAIAGATPFLSSDASGLRFWKYMGNGPVDLAVYVMTHPAQIFAAIQTSAFLDLNRSFGWLSLVSPAGWFANLAAMPMYLARPDEFMAKRLLLLYNSAMILPGMVVSVLGAIKCGLRLASTAKRFLPWQYHHTPNLLVIVASILLVKPVVQDRQWLSLLRSEGDLYHPTRTLIKEVQASCQVDSIASDYYGVTLTPNSLLRYVLPNVHDADLVLITDRLRYSPNPQDRDILFKSLGGYRIHAEADRFILLIKKETHCTKR